MTSRFKPVSLSNSGFTLMELLMVIAILGVLAVMSITPITNSLDESRFQDTVERLKTLRNALIGDQTLVSNGTRTNFGYLGDVGGIPTVAQGIAALLALPAGVSPFTLVQTARISVGWNGPYVTSNQPSMNFTKDGWGRTIVYSVTGTPSLTSYGADGIAGGTGLNTDIVVQMPTTSNMATVYGFISSNGNPYAGDANVDINYPNGAGAMTTGTYTLTAPDKGRFSFTSIPFGLRSVTVYIPSKASPKITLGPVILAVDNANYVIPGSVLDVGDISGALTTLSCATESGIVTKTGATSLPGGKTLKFNLKITNNVLIDQIGLTNSANTSFTQWVSTSTYKCTGNNQLYPCTGTGGGARLDGTATTVTPNLTLVSGNSLAHTLTFASSITGSGTATFIISHNLGCDTISFTGL